MYTINYIIQKKHIHVLPSHNLKSYLLLTPCLIILSFFVALPNMWNSFCLLLLILSLFTSKVYVSWDQGSCSPRHFYISSELSNKPGIEKIAILSCYLLDLKIIAFRNRERSKIICLNSHFKRKLRLCGITYLGRKAGLESDPPTPSFEWLYLSLHLSTYLPTWKGFPGSSSLGKQTTLLEDPGHCFGGSASVDSFSEIWSQFCL